LLPSFLLLSFFQQSREFAISSCNTIKTKIKNHEQHSHIIAFQGCLHQKASD
jgi:hypothetical protein